MPSSGVGIDEVITINGTQERVISSCDTKRGNIFVNYYTAYPGSDPPAYTVSDGFYVAPIPAGFDCSSTAALEQFAIDNYPNRTIL